ncbi:ubiquinone anaerobic biosynthesis accessory factor UbiT [Roseateles sp. DB2]|uniref:ubiquinone anaerobic biosynthesis accessory factor UbiT n=1 Tax=Roseateles sp. DB2 TaxID=3453717 RepID=UPI003EE889B0
MQAPLRDPASHPSAPAGLHKMLLDHVRGVVRRLPVEPPSFVAARLLDQFLLPRLDASQRQGLSHKAMELELLEPGIRLRLLLGDAGFTLAPREAPVLLRIRARTPALWRLLRGEEDADRLFFDRALVMEGDTEFGLMLKNTLDAIGPLLPATAFGRPL